VYVLPETSLEWLDEQIHLAPDLCEALKNPEATETSTVLKRYGSDGRGGSFLEGLEEALRLPGGKVRIRERAFLECCLEATKDGTTISKLVGAVQRQASFVEKMEKQLWLRSPAVEGTLRRAVVRYHNFLKLFKLYPKTMLVPTLDIDLVWHTHQCSPRHYEAGTMNLVGRFVDHDDKLGKDKLDNGFTNTKDLYRMRFGEDYQRCNCWDCEALLSVISEEGSEAQVRHVTESARRVHEDVAYYRTVEIARRKGLIQQPA
jgi:hypothetical protein